MNFRISVVITCYSEGALILDAVNSVRQQTLSCDELIIVNDASADKQTNTICRELESQPDTVVVWLKQNGGPSVSRNAGFSRASGDILVPLDADDILPKEALFHIHQAFISHPDAGFIYGNYIRQDSPGKSQIIIMDDISLSSMLRPRCFSLSTNWTLLGTAPLRRSLWQEVGGIDPSMGKEDLHDVDFWIRAMSLPCKFYRVSDVIYTWRKYLGNNSGFVTPMSWYRLAQKHSAVYKSIGLESRALELLLLGSKWSGNVNKTRKYRHALLRSLIRSDHRISSFFVLLAPSHILRFLFHLRGVR